MASLFDTESTEQNTVVQALGVHVTRPGSALPQDQEGEGHERRRVRAASGVVGGAREVVRVQVGLAGAIRAIGVECEG